MPIKYFDAYLHDRNHLSSLPLLHLSDTRLGIDASYYLHSLIAPSASSQSAPLSPREPLLAATGGLPLSLTQRIEADLRVLEKLRIKPVFVFPGLVPASSLQTPPAAALSSPSAGNKRWRPQQQPFFGATMDPLILDACRDRRDAWSKYEQAHEDAATRLFDGRSGLAHSDLWRMVLRIFRHRNVEFLVAPYVSWPQLVYLQRHPKAYIHAIYAPTDLLLYHSVDKLITSLDLYASTPSFQYTSKRALLADLALSEDQFLDVAILLGSDPSPHSFQSPSPYPYSAYSFTYPHLPTPSFPPIVHDQALKATIDMVKYYKSGHAAVCAFDHPALKATGPPGAPPTAGYLEPFARARSIVRFALVIGSEGSVAPLPLALSAVGVGPPHHHHQPPPVPITPSDIPQDLHDLFTPRLPDQVYFYLSRGLMSPHSLVWLTMGSITEYPPLDNGETTEYKRFVREVVTEGQTGPRATALAVLCAGLGGSWAAGNRKVSYSFWFDQPGQGGQQQGPKLIMHNSPQTVQLAERVAGWNVSYAVIEDELRRQNSSTIDFALCLGATSTERLAARTKIKNPTPLEKKDEAVANVIWRFLELRGFLLNTHTHSPLAKAMYTAILMAKLNDKFQDPLYLFLELVRAGVMHGHLWSNRAFSGGPSFGTDEEKSSMLLIMRVLSIVPLNFKPVAWSAPLSRELLVFNSFIKSLSRALRVLMEVVVLSMLMRGDVKRGGGVGGGGGGGGGGREDFFLDFGLSLPFQGEVNTGFGVLAKVYLDALSHLNGGVRVRKEDLEKGDLEGGVGAMKAMALEVVEDTFGGVKNPKMEVERGFRFWDLAICAVRVLGKEGAVLKDLVEQFESADEWLGPMRP